MRAVLSTNGTLITEEIAAGLAGIGLSYVGVSIDGLRDVNDRFRGTAGAFDLALRGIRNCIGAGVKVGLRFTMTKRNVGEIPGIFKLLEEENIPRVCLYHLVYAGRGGDLRHEDLDAAGCRAALDRIIDLTADLHARGMKKEVLTVDNHADGVYLYLRMRAEGSPRAAKVLDLLTMNGGNGSGIGIGCVSGDGEVHADQFWRHRSFGNVKERSFGELWTDTSDELMAGLKNRGPLLKGRCGRCVYRNLCNGNFRVRAEAVSGDVWGEDAACFLTEEEITSRYE
jgi:radical SAM protein with 4Fe4S-binding SPASM domain